MPHARPVVFRLMSLQEGKGGSGEARVTGWREPVEWSTADVRGLPAVRLHAASTEPND